MDANQELRDASGLVDDWRALRQLIATDGYVFFRGLLDPDQVKAIGRTGLGHLQDAGWIEPGPDPVMALPRTPVRAVKMRDAFTDPGYRAILADPGFTMVPFVGPLATVMHQLLGPGGFCYPFKLPRVVYPAALVPRQPGNVVHMDYGGVQDMFTSWVPLDDVPLSRGGLAIQPGSQTTTRVRHRQLDRLPPGWRSADYRAGDVLIFHCLTTHAALPNREDRMRFSAEYRWQLADQPAPRRLVIGPHGGEIGARLFGGTPWWRPAPPGLRLFDDGGGRQPILPPAPSRYVAVRG